MTRAILELLFTVFVILIARALLSSFFRGFSNAATASQGPPSPAQPVEVNGRNLHKDPVCGTYVAEATRFQRVLNGQTVYYCSNECREKHSLVAR